jgi:HEPN domain-containing protein
VEQVNKTLAIEWLRASYLDIENLKYIKDVEYLTPMIAFHSQQAIEKSFKAIIVFYDNKIPKQHDLLKLKTMLNNKLIIDNEDILEVLNELYIESRYPSSIGLLPYGKPTLDDAKEFYSFAFKIFNEALNILNITLNEIRG